MKRLVKTMHEFKPGSILVAEVQADGSIMLSDEARSVDAASDPDIKAAYANGICSAASEQVEIKALAGGKSLRAFSMNAYTGAAMKIPSFFRPVIIDLSGMRLASKSLPILRNHDSERIVAHTDDIEVSERRLRASGLMSGVGGHVQEILQLSDNGFPWQASVGASVERMEYVDAGGTAKVNGRNVEGPLNVARQSTLREISFVPLGADPGTSAKVSEEK